MYLCTVCFAVSKPGQDLLRWQEFKTNGDIRLEVPVCPACLQRLQQGASYAALVKAHAPPRPNGVTHAPAQAQEPQAPREPVAPATPEPPKAKPFTLKPAKVLEAWRAKHVAPSPADRGKGKGKQ